MLVTDTDEAASGQIQQLQALRPGLALLEQSGAERFDPVRFRYIQSMARRALEQRPAVAEIIETKALKALRDYQADFAREREQAAIVVARAAEESADAAENIQRVFDSGDFKAVLQMRGRAEASATQMMLSELTQTIVRAQGALDVSPNERSFDDILRQQEDDLVAAFSDSAADPDSMQSGNVESGEFGELQSIRRFRESLVKRNADKLVTESIKHAPENAGPLNPQMLVIHSLATMRDLSPHYMSRFVSYIDTLLWLEQAYEPSAAAAGKKASAKSGGKGSARQKSKR
jgi:hypothetical protein